MDSFSTIDAVMKTVDFLTDALKSSSKAEATDEDYISRIKKYITEHYNSELSIKELADFVHLSPEYLTRLFKKETGMTPKDYIIECRISTAKDLLANSSLPVSMIASEVGYHNFSYFAFFSKNWNKLHHESIGISFPNNPTESDFSEQHTALNK